MFLCFYRFTTTTLHNAHDHSFSPISHTCTPMFVVIRTSRRACPGGEYATGLLPVPQSSFVIPHSQYLQFVLPASHQGLTLHPQTLNRSTCIIFMFSCHSLNFILKLLVLACVHQSNHSSNSSIKFSSTSHSLYHTSMLLFLPQTTILSVLNLISLSLLTLVVRRCTS